MLLVIICEVSVKLCVKRELLSCLPTVAFDLFIEVKQRLERLHPQPFVFESPFVITSGPILIGH